jgi:hypothetical protein
MDHFETGSLGFGPSKAGEPLLPSWRLPPRLSRSSFLGIRPPHEEARLRR